MEDFKKDPVNANPYLVLTLFDELVRVKQLALMRGDVIWGLTQDEGGTVMEMLLDSYLVDSEFEKVRQFNHSPAEFDFDRHTQESVQKFKAKFE